MPQLSMLPGLARPWRRKQEFARPFRRCTLRLRKRCDGFVEDCFHQLNKLRLINRSDCTHRRFLFYQASSYSNYSFENVSAQNRAEIGELFIEETLLLQCGGPPTCPSKGERIEHGYGV
jgi:hypothetical protein